MGGITLGTQRGYAAEQEVVAELSRQVGLPVSTAMNATVQAIKHLNTRSTVIATANNQAVKKYYEDGGLEVVAIKGLEVSKPVDQVKLPDYASDKVARELYRLHPAADSLLIQGRWRSVAYVQELEDDTQKPPVSSTAAPSGGSSRSRNQSSDPRFWQTFAGLSPRCNTCPEAALTA